MEDHRRGMKLENSGEDDIIKPIETSITYPKKVRVMVSDPDATDSSSDETGDGERSLPRRIIREIVLGVRAGDKPGDEALKPTDSVDQKQKQQKLRGVRMRKWGKWCAEVRDPHIKKRLWLGTFNTAEEAAKVYNAKKEEIRARQTSQNQPFTRDREVNNSLNVEKMVNLDQNPTRKRSKGVRKMNSGRWGVKIRDPFKKSQVWLGTYDTEEEASKAFELKKVEFVSKRTLSASKIGSYLKTPKTETLTLGSAHGGEIVVGN